MSTSAIHRASTLAQAVAASPDGLVVLTQSWDLDAANPAAMALLGGGNGLERGRPFSAMVPRGQRACVEEWLLRLTTGDPLSPLRLEWRIPISPIVAESKRPSTSIYGALIITGRARPGGGFVLCVRPATAVPPLDPSLLQSERLRSLGGLVAGIAHEINNPLTGILGFAEMLARSATDESLRRDLERIHESASRCHAVVHDLLAFAREGAHQTLTLDLPDVIDRILGLQEYHLRSRGVEIVRRFDRSAPPCRADRRMLEYALLAILRNATDAVRHGGRIRVTTESAGDRVAIEIADNGDGIPPDVLPHVFDPFFTTKPEGDGRGLGLTLAHANVEALGGWLRIRSLYGVGTRVRIALPAADTTNGEPEPALRPSASPAPHRRPRVLIVDDEFNIRALVIRLLTQDGCDVVEAEHGLDALRKIEQESFDCILSDLRMPTCSGPELYRILSARQPDAACRMVFLTGDVLSPEIHEFLETQPGPVLEKPFDIESLRSTCAPFLGRGDGR